MAVAAGAAGLAVAPAVQLRARRYRAGVYWLAVVMVSVFGTMAADVLHVGLGIPYAVSTTAFAVALVPIARGGLGWGTGPVTAAWAVVIVVLVGYLAARRDS